MGFRALPGRRRARLRRRLGLQADRRQPLRGTARRRRGRSGDDGRGRGVSTRSRARAHALSRRLAPRLMVEEAKLVEKEGGLEPEGPGWFVLNAREARWLDGHFGAYTRFEGDARFPEVGINIGVLAPGQPACY